MKKIFAGIVLASFLLFLGTPAIAASLTQAQINSIISLLQSFGANSSVINNVRVSLSGGMPIISEGGNNGSNPIQPTLTCARFSHNLYLGQSDKETGNEVSKLQKFLKDLGHFTYPTITGYYGPATEQAVQKFQVSQGVVSSGFYETTGYGVVGPKTQEKIVSISCGNQTTTTLSPSTPGSTQKTEPTLVPSSVNPEIDQICKNANGLNPKLLGDLVSGDLILLATKLQSDCAKFHSGELGLNMDLMKSNWDSYQQLVNWDKSLLVALISNPTTDSFRNLCNNADKIKTPFASTKKGLSQDRMSVVLISVPYTLYDIMMCKDFSEASSTVIAVTPGLLQWDFDSNDSDTLRARIIDYNNELEETKLLGNGDVVAIQNTIVPFIDQTTKHLITAKQGDIGEMTDSRTNPFATIRLIVKQGISFKVFNPVKWAKKVINNPAEAMNGTGAAGEGLVMHLPNSTIINTFNVLVKSAKNSQ